MNSLGAQVSNAVNTGRYPKEALMNLDLFRDRNLAGMRKEFVSDIEQAVFFDRFETLRPSMRIRDFSGAKYIGQIFGGKRDGMGIYYNRNGDIYIGNWVQNSMTGECIYFYNNGAIYAGSVQDGKKHGFGRMLYNNGDLYEGAWQEDMKNGMGLYSFYSTGEIYKGDYALGVREGVGTLFHPNDFWVEGVWRSGVMVSERLFGEGSLDHPISSILEFYADPHEK